MLIRHTTTYLCIFGKDFIVATNAIVLIEELSWKTPAQQPRLMQPSFWQLLYEKAYSASFLGGGVHCFN